MIPVALSIAGFDCCAGAGLQADLKTFSALGIHGLTASTCLVAETPLEVTLIDAVAPEMLREQISLLLTRYPVSAIKTGMLYDTAQIEVVAGCLKDCRVPVVVDPVMLASTGDPLLRLEASTLFQEQILSKADVITPNRAEAEFLLNKAICANDFPAKNAALQLAERYDCACVLKGGHLDHSKGAVDLLALEGTLLEFSSEWVDIPSAHGTGCTFAAAMTAELAKGNDVTAAAKSAKTFVSKALASAHRWPQDSGEDLIALDQVQLLR